MIDLHCHILPGVDDGPASLDEALEMARFCVRDGITHITATPHCNRRLRLLRAEVLPHVARFNEELSRAGLALVVFPGSEIQVTDTGEYRVDYEGDAYCHLGDDGGFTLLEFPWNRRHYPSDAPGLVAWLRDRGTVPIVAHPERHDYFRDRPALLRALVEAGAWIQVTVDSLLGNHGAQPRSSSAELLRDYPEAVLATDAHNPHRCSGLSAGYALVRERFGAPRADDLRARADAVLRHLLTVSSRPD